MRNLGLQGLVRGPVLNAGNNPENTVYSWPNPFVAELFVFVLTLAVILVPSMFFSAPLEEPVNMTHPPNPATAARGFRA